MALVRYMACDRGADCACSDDGNGPDPSCLWFFWGKRDDGGLGQVLGDALRACEASAKQGQEVSEGTQDGATLNTSQITRKDGGQT